MFVQLLHTLLLILVISEVVLLKVVCFGLEHSNLKKNFWGSMLPVPLGFDSISLPSHVTKTSSYSTV